VVEGVVVMANTNFKSGLILFPLLFVAACAQKPEVEENVRLVIENDEAVLAQRVTRPNTDIPLDTPPAKGALPGGEGIASAPTFAVGDSATLTLVAEVASPVVDGNVLQATEVRVRGDYAYVSYNMNGEQFIGGVEIIDVSNPDNPKLVSSAIVKDTDVHAMTIHRDDVYLAGGSSNPNLSTPAMLERFSVLGGKVSSESTLIDIPSFAATDVDVAGGYVYVTSGAELGYVSVLNRSDLSLSTMINFDNARGVDTNKGSKVAAISGETRDGTAARLVVFDRDSGAILPGKDFSFPGAATIQDSKSTVEIKKDIAFLGLGDGGTKIVCMNDGTVIKEFPQPIIAGLHFSKTVTNSVSAYKRALFMSNGEAGIYMALAAKDFNKHHDDEVTRIGNGCAVDALEIVGQLQFGVSESANHVVYRKKLLYVASGLGGLKIVKVNVSGKNSDNELHAEYYHDDDDETDN